MVRGGRELDCCAVADADVNAHLDASTDVQRGRFGDAHIGAGPDVDTKPDSGIDARPDGGSHPAAVAIGHANPNSHGDPDVEARARAQTRRDDSDDISRHRGGDG